MNNQEIIKKINNLRVKRDAVIMAHYYQTGDVQEIADFVGDSLELARTACKVDNKVIILCGVRFMAESAKILNPEKIVLLPVLDAGCPLADMISVEKLTEKKAEYPDAMVTCYVNSSVETKAESDICCTSANAVRILNSIKGKQILFVPDKNLGNYASKFASGKEVILWDGYCPIHHEITGIEVKKMKKLHPFAEVLVHPECRDEVIKLSDFVGSTSQILKRVKKSQAKEMIIGTEKGLLHRLKKDNPDKKFYLLSPNLICEDMKKITLQNILEALENMKYEIIIEEEIRIRAVEALERMLLVKEPMSQRANS